ncbi:hypothetical protein [Citromicrobium bathyomarinum]|uniref:hypothetical protein n=1 Tax=Citromicrobium bathyomarinum TaxID=72174 RepID=UPI00315B1CAA
MNRTMVGLIAVILLLVGAVAFLLGQRNTDADSQEPANDETVIVSSDDDTGAEEQRASATAAPKALAVRIGRDGPHASACDRIGRVANLPGGSDDFLSVREAPSIDATRIDKLDDDAPFFVCDRQGQWYGIVYLPDGTLGEPGQCGLENSVGAPQPYSGACLTGWVSSRYVDASGTQDSDEPYVEEGDDAGGPRVVQVSASGPSQVIAVTRLSAKAESEYDKPVGQRPDGNRVSCRETGTGDAAWTCSATYTLTN